MISEANYPAHTVSDIDGSKLIMVENGRRYRMLMVGETIEAGDQYQTIQQPWSDMDWNCIGERISGPEENGSYPQGWYRRPITD